MSLDEISMHSPLPEHLSDDEKVLDIGLVSPRRRGRPSYDPRDSLSSVDINEVPPLRDEDDAEPPPPFALPPKLRKSASEPRARAPLRLSLLVFVPGV